MTWDAAEAALVDLVARSPEPITAATIGNAREFLLLARAICPPPDELARGYWPTVCVTWDNTQFEIFDDHVECYPLSGRQFDAWHASRTPGEPWPGVVLDALDRIAEAHAPE